LAVALKVNAHDAGHKELEVLKCIGERTAHDTSSQFIVKMLDYFDHIGPNGTHLCLVLELMCFNVPILFGGYRAEPNLCVSLAREISKQLLRGLQVLQNCGVIHNGKVYICVTDN
jgi:serine/threonine-protein kinase SRPK3